MLPGNVLCLTFTNKATENLRLRVRRALAHLELAEGEEPEILNYHGFAAALLDRYGLLAGVEPGAARAEPGPARGALRPRARRMTFEHAAGRVAALAGRARSSSSTTRLQNHRVAPERGVAWLHDRLEALQEPPVGARVSTPREERIELAEAGDRLPRAEARSSA